MLEYVFACLLIVGCWLWYQAVIHPRKLHQHYVKILRNRGYKVWEIPFKPFSVPLFNKLQENQKEGDGLKTFKQIYPHYDVVVTNSYHKVMVDFIHPDFIRDYYSKDMHYKYPKANSISFPVIRMTFGGGLVFSQGNAWTRKRKILNRVFNFDLIRSQTDKISQICDDSIKELEQKAKKMGDETLEYSIIDLSMRIFSTVVGECFLGGSSQEYLQGETVPAFQLKSGDVAVEQGRGILAFLFKEKFLNLNITAKNKLVNHRMALVKQWEKDFIREKVKETFKRVKELKQRKQPTDIIEALVMDQVFRQSEKSEENGTLNEDELLEQFIIFLGAGSDTTTNFWVFMVAEMIKNPQIEAKVRAEIDQYMLQDNYSYENLKNLKYIEYLQKETTRCYGPVNWLLIREAAQDHYLNGIQVKKSTQVSFNFFGNHFNPNYFKDPEVFRPERWERQCDHLPVYVSGGFSGGGRTCIGKHLALLESKIALIKFLKRYSEIKIEEKVRGRYMSVYKAEPFWVRLRLGK